MTRRNILLTCAGGFQGHTLLKELRDLPGIETHVISNDQESICRYLADKYAVSPQVADEEDYLQFLSHYVAENSIELIIPTTPYDLEILSRSKQEFREKWGCLIAVSDSSILSVFLDKSRSLDWLEKNGLPTFRLLEADEIKENLPVFGRPNHGWGNKDSLVINHSSELPSSEEASRYAWTVFLRDFSEYSIDFCIGFDKLISEPTVRQRKATVCGFAVVLEESALSEPALNYIQQLTEAITKAGGLGIFNVQLIEDQSGQRKTQWWGRRWIPRAPRSLLIR